MRGGPDGEGPEREGPDGGGTVAGDNGTWEVILDERKALASDLGAVGTDAWETRSLCDDWTVRDVVAHMTATSKLSGPKFLFKIAGAGFNLGRLQRRDIAMERGDSPAETLSRFEAQLDSRGRPPGPLDTMLGEVLVHSEDVRRPLGIAHRYPTEALTRLADFYAGSNLIIGGKRRVDGVTLRATDTDWSHGAGPVAAGPMLEIVLGITGRRNALDRLEGAGVDTLRARS
ncbi:MAG: maleylpyruvate isomerase family mycothiol-dependent enzyme [Actinobacteria bacterium]|nr:maleylpyruvate isomerase family mycothiol-dependent enzyme [Actinomycetota bacterium]